MCTYKYIIRHPNVSVCLKIVFHSVPFLPSYLVTWKSLLLRTITSAFFVDMLPISVLKTDKITNSTGRYEIWFYSLNVTKYLQLDVDFRVCFTFGKRTMSELSSILKVFHWNKLLWNRSSYGIYPLWFHSNLLGCILSDSMSWTFGNTNLLPKYGESHASNTHTSYGTFEVHVSKGWIVEVVNSSWFFYYVSVRLTNMMDCNHEIV